MIIVVVVIMVDCDVFRNSFNAENARIANTIAAFYSRLKLIETQNTNLNLHRIKLLQFFK